MMKTMYKALTILLLTSFFLTPNIISKSNNGNIKLEITGFENNDGKARILLFNKAKRKYYPSKDKHAYKKVIVPIKNKKVKYTFENVPYGDYAFSIHHDEDNDGKLSTNWLGIPNEALGSSNNAKGHFGPPTFEEASFKLNKSSITIKIKVEKIL